jgi:hypothetical protein
MITVADSEADFGGTQGLKGWFYGYYPVDTLNGTFATNRMTFNVAGPSWNGPSSFGTPIIADTFMHPGGGSGYNTPVRRYVINAAGEETVNTDLPIRISGRFWDQNLTGGNVTAFVTVDGVTIWSFIAFENSTRDNTPAVFDLAISVVPGSVIDFGLNRNGDFSADGHAMAAKIEGRSMPGGTMISIR